MILAMCPLQTHILPGLVSGDCPALLGEDKAATAAAAAIITVVLMSGNKPASRVGRAVRHSQHNTVCLWLKRASGSSAVYREHWPLAASNSDCCAPRVK